MNREQMIAWLTLEGWVPLKSLHKEVHTAYWLWRDTIAVYTGHGDFAASTTAWSNVGNHPKVSWEEFPIVDLENAYEEIIRHEPR